MENGISQSIRIYTNESIPVAIAEGLKRRGIDARSCCDVNNYGLTDEHRRVKESS